MSYDLISYPRTEHLEGSRLQEGDDDHHVPFEVAASDPDAIWIIEEKVDAANSGVSFSDELDLLTQSRGHFLTGGHRERHFDLFIKWSAHHQDVLLDVLMDRYIMYGEWMYAYHTIFYDQLTHLFMEFDIWDKHEGFFLSTAARRRLIGNAPIVSVPVLYEGPPPGSLKEVTALLSNSLYKSENWYDNFVKAVDHSGMSEEYKKKVIDGTLNTRRAEGLYIKIEKGDKTIGRYKWVHHQFVQTILDNKTHWLDRPIVQNQLAEGVDIWAR